MYTAMKGQNYRLKEFLKRNASIDEQTSTSGPLMDFDVPEKFTSATFESQDDGTDSYEIGFT